MPWLVPDQNIRDLPLMRALSARLGTQLRYGLPPPAPSELVVGTETQFGWTIRAYSQTSDTDKSIALLWSNNRSWRNAFIHPVDHFTTYLPNTAATAINAYQRFAPRIAHNVGVDNRWIISVAMLLQHADELAHHLNALAQDWSLLPGTVWPPKVRPN